MDVAVERLTPVMQTVPPLDTRVGASESWPDARQALADRCRPTRPFAHQRAWTVLT
jgi:hypothetical protein